MAWFRINETKYLCHCIKQLKKLALDPQPEKNVQTTLLLSSWKFFLGRGAREIWPFVWDFLAVSSLPGAVLCSKLLSPWKSGQMAFVCGIGCSSKGQACSRDWHPRAPGMWCDTSQESGWFVLDVLCGVHVGVFRGFPGRNAVADCDNQVLWGTEQLQHKSCWRV